MEAKIPEWIAAVKQDEPAPGNSGGGGRVPAGAFTNGALTGITLLRYGTNGS